MAFCGEAGTQFRPEGVGYLCRITERVKLEGSTVGHLVQPLLKQGCSRAFGTGFHPDGS